MTMNTTVGWPYKMLTRERHSRLVDNIHEVCQQAGVAEDMVDEPMATFCGKDEINWVKKYRDHAGERKGGMLLVGAAATPDPGIRMQAMGAAFLRNYIDARVISINKLFPKDQDDDVPDPTVLLIPDFYHKPVGSQALTNWQIQFLHGYLLSRHTARKQTILHMDSISSADVMKNIGQSFLSFLVSHWDVIEIA